MSAASDSFSIETVIPMLGPNPVCRLGLATRGANNLVPGDILHALDWGVNFLNWCGHPDALSQAVSMLGVVREVRGWSGGTKRPGWPRSQGIDAAWQS